MDGITVFSAGHSRGAVLHWLDQVFTMSKNKRAWAVNARRRMVGLFDLGFPIMF